MDIKNILITGGCGFLGQYLTQDLLSAFPDAHIGIIDLNPSKTNIFDFTNHPNLRTELGTDICNYDSLPPHFEDIDTVIHLAGLVSFSLKDADRLFAVNVDGTKNVLKAAIDKNVKNFIHISSVAALGFNDNKDAPVDEEFTFDFRLAKKRKKYYMLSKHLADIELEKLAPASINTVILYPGLMFGPGDITNSAHLINAICQRKIPFNMPGGTNIVDVRDVASGITAVLQNAAAPGRFLLSGRNLEFHDINATIAKALSVRPPALTLPKLICPLLFKILLLAEKISSKQLALTADNLDSASKYRYFDNTKAHTMLQWQPKIEFTQTVKDTIDWMKKNDLLKR